MINVFIQNEADSNIKNTHNEKTLEFKGSRRILLPYPYPYGFITETSAEDGGNVDCYVITKDSLKSGAILECSPIGLLEQFEGDEIDHKVLATIPGENIEINENLLSVFQDFIYGIFSEFPGKLIRVDRILPLEAALSYIQSCSDK